MPGEASDEGSIRVATPADRVPVSRVLDGALLEVAGLPERLADGTVLVASVADAVVGAVVLAPEGSPERTPPADWPDAVHVRSIAVRRKHRRRGIGTELLRAARARWGPLVADFDGDVAAFYAALDAEYCVDSDGRHWALLREA